MLLLIILLLSLYTSECISITEKEHRIAFGSCNNAKNIGIWDVIEARSPHRLVLLGDNIYADKKTLPYKVDVVFGTLFQAAGKLCWVIFHFSFLPYHCCNYNNTAILTQSLLCTFSNHTLTHNNIITIIIVILTPYDMTRPSRLWDTIQHVLQIPRLDVSSEVFGRLATGPYHGYIWWSWLWAEQCG